MANNKKVVQQLQILLETMGYQKVDREIKSVASGMKRVETQSNATATAQNRLKRTQEGVHKTSLAQGKEFSRQAQGLGGLVRAYATVAANVFALSSAFLVLKRAADFDSMMISANSMTKVMGVNVARLSKDLQAATGANLSFAQSLEITNKALAAGFNASQFSELGTIVSKISQTFGGSIEANMNKVTQAILRGRTETLSTMGVVIDLEQAYTSYALTLGKTRQELTKFEEQQATLNAFLQEGRKQVGDIQQDPNPYDKMLRGLQDVAQEMMTTLSANLFNPIISLLNESKQVANALIITLAAVFARNLTPDMAGYASAAKASVRETTGALQKLARARTRYDTARGLGATGTEVQRNAANKVVQQFAMTEEQKKKLSDKTAKYRITLANVTAKKIIEKDAETMAALKKSEAVLTQRMTALEKKGMKGSSSYNKLSAERDIVAAARGDSVRSAAATNALITPVETLGTKARLTTTSIGAFTASMKKQSAQSRVNTLNMIRMNGVILGTAQAYKKALAPLRLYNAGKVQFSKATAVAMVTARMFGTTMALVGTAINKVIPMLTMLWLAVEVGRAIYNKFKGSVTKDMEAVREAIKASQEQSKEFEKKITDLDQLLINFEHDSTFNNLARAINFVGNATAESANEITKLIAEVRTLATIKNAEGNFTNIVERIEELNKEKTRLENYIMGSSSTVITGSGWKFWQTAFDPAIEGLAKVNEELDLATKKLEALVVLAPDTINNIFGKFNLVKSLREQAGMRPEVVEEQIESVFQAAKIAAAREGRDVGVLINLEELFFAGASESRVNTFIETYKEELGTAIPLLGLLSSTVLNNVSNIDSATANAVKNFETLALNLQKTQQESKNAYLKAINSNETVSMLQEFNNSLRTVELAGIDAENKLNQIFEKGEAKVIKEQFGIETVDQLKTFIADALAQYNALAKTMNDIKNEAENLKTTTMMLKSLDMSLASDNIRVEQTAKIAENEKDILANKAKEARAQEAIIRQDIRVGKLTGENAVIADATAKSLIYQAQAYEMQLKNINPLYEAEKERFKILEEFAKLQNSLLGNQTDNLNIQKSFASNAIELYEWEKKRIALQSKRREADRSNLKRREEELLLEIEEGRRLGTSTPGQMNKAQRELMALKGEQLALEANIVAERRENAREELEAAARAGDFSATRKTFALAFVTEYDKFIRNFESAGKRVGDAIITALDSGIDLVIDNLLTGEANFKESLKGIAREGVGGVLKDNMKLASRTILNEVGKMMGMGKGEEKDPAFEAQLSQLQELEVQTNLLRLLAQAAGATAQELARATAGIMRWETAPTTSSSLVPDSILNPNPPEIKSEESIKTVDVAIQQLEESKLQTEQLRLIATKATTVPAPEDKPKLEMLPVSTGNQTEDLSSSKVLNALGSMKTISTTQSSVPVDPVLTNIMNLTQLQFDQSVQQTGLLANIANTPPPAGAEDIKAMGEDVKVATSEASQSALAGMGSLFSSLLGGLGGDGPAGSFLQTFGSALFSRIPGFANGGVIKGGINSYANGTITSGPELAVIGEGRRNEAVVPLPNNREIPVQLSGDSGNKVEVNQMFDFKNADPSTERRLRTEANRIKQESFNSVFKEINRGGRFSKAVGRR